jgi:hypothetical protein
MAKAVGVDLAHKGKKQVIANKNPISQSQTRLSPPLPIEKKEGKKRREN